jgi:hypothetical protein
MNAVMTTSSNYAANQINAFVTLAGKQVWLERIAALQRDVTANTRYGKLVGARYAAEFAVEKARRGVALHGFELNLATRVAALAALHDGLGPAAQVRFAEALHDALSGAATLIPLLHLHRTAQLQMQRGFAVRFAGFEDAAPFDLLISRDGAEAEIACDILSAEDGRFVHRAAWMRLMDRVDPDLQTWLAAHPGRYLLKMTLPQGLQDGAAGTAPLAQLHQRINAMLAGSTRSDHDEAAVLRLDPLMLAGAQASENGLMNSLRRDFGPEAHLAVTNAGAGLFVMAARGSTENEVAIAMRRRLAALAPARLSGTRPGIIAMFIEDTNRVEWRLLRQQLTLEGEARQFLTAPEARSVVAVTCASRFELCEVAGDDAAPEGELRFRNPSHPAAKSAALAPSVVSSV